jgi:acetyl-CoA/propionyl-CoA carboxylase biotin carboxyl carrier protein
VHLSHEGATWTIDDVRFERRTALAGESDPELRSPMPGAVVALFVGEGDVVDAGTPVLSVEAMKMEHVLRAPHRGAVTLRVEVGSQVAADEVVASLSQPTGAATGPPAKEGATP